LTNFFSHIALQRHCCERLAPAAKDEVVCGKVTLGTADCVLHTEHAKRAREKILTMSPGGGKAAKVKFEAVVDPHGFELTVKGHQE
jgi:hypothetical protein